MNKKLYMACAGAISLAVLGCSDDGISGSSEDPNVLTAYGSSSSGTIASSSSFVDIIDVRILCLGIAEDSLQGGILVESKEFLVDVWRVNRS